MEPADWIDISVPIHDGMVRWPGDPAVQVQRTHAIEHGDEANLTQLSMSAHTGTHMDAPLHYLPGTASMDAVPFTAIIGAARVAAMATPGPISRHMLESAGIQIGERLLLKTRNSDHPWSKRAFDPRFTALNLEAARWLARQRIRLLGVDYLSVGPCSEEGAEVHRALLGAGIWIIEGLNLSAVKPGPYELICLPLRLAGAEGAPARALLRPLPAQEEAGH
ncbi:MAG: cyclase family protein [Nitrococcus mobilis]|nr:cyclase family protein [Nitrococcus mobilis]